MTQIVALSALALAACQGARAAPPPASTDAGLLDALAADDPPAADGIWYRDRATVAGGDFALYCATPTRVVLVTPRPDRHQAWPATVTTITPDGHVRHGVIASARCHDHCGDNGDDGHAGCSERGTCDLKSNLRGARRLTSTIFIEGAFDTLTAVDGTPCEPADQRVVAVCAGRTHRAAVIDLDAFEAPSARPHRFELTLGAGRRTRTLSAGVVTAAPDNASRTYRFVDGRAVVEVSIGDGTTPTGELRIDGRAEACLAFAG